LLPLAGKPMLTHIVEKIPASIPITVSTNAAFAEPYFAWRKTIDRENLEIVIERTTSDDQKLGTNGAVAQWIREAKLDEDLLLLTGDNYLGFSMDAFLESFDPKRPILAAYDIKDLGQASKFGTVILDLSEKLKATQETEETNESGNSSSSVSFVSSVSSVKAFEEKPKEPKTTLVSTGCYAIPKTCLPIVVEYAKDHPDNIGGIFEEFLRQGISVDCFRFDEPWFDIGSFDVYIEATRKLVGEQCLQAKGVTLTETICEGSVVIDAGSTITKSTLRDTVVFGGSTIDDCVIDRCVIDEGCVLKGVDLTGKMIRAGTVLKRTGIK